MVFAANPGSPVAETLPGGVVSKIIFTVSVLDAQRAIATIEPSGWR